MDSQKSVDKREKSTVDRRSLKAAAASPQSGAMWRWISGLSSVGHVRDKIWKYAKINCVVKTKVKKIKDIEEFPRRQRFMCYWGCPSDVGENASKPEWLYRKNVARDLIGKRVM